MSTFVMEGHESRKFKALNNYINNKEFFLTFLTGRRRQIGANIKTHLILLRIGE